MHVRPAPAPSPLPLRARLVLAGAICIACVTTPPDSTIAVSAAIADWASIVLAALPYVVFGAFAATLARRFASRWPLLGHNGVAALTVFNPGCDCALNGFAGALARAHPALAGFALTFAAAASPASLAVTYAAFGMHMTAARTAGGAIAAALTAAAWSIGTSRGVLVHAVLGQASLAQRVDCTVVGQASLAQRVDCTVGGQASLAQRVDCTVGGQASLAPSVGPTFMVGQVDDDHSPDLATELAAALAGIAFAAVAAVAAKLLVPAAVFSHMIPAGAALLGALLSPCSTADPLLAAALLHNVRAQISFMLSAQCLDVRQMLLVQRHFGTTRMAAAAGCAAIACALATMFA